MMSPQLYACMGAAVGFWMVRLGSEGRTTTTRLANDERLRMLLSSEERQLGSGVVEPELLPPRLPTAPPFFTTCTLAPCCPLSANQAERVWFPVKKGRDTSSLADS